MAKTIDPCGFDPSRFELDSVGGGSSFTNDLRSENSTPETAGGKIRSNGWELLSRDQIEAEYGLTRRWLELAAHQGQGPPMLRLSRRMVRYRRADFEAWLAAHIIDNSAE